MEDREEGIIPNGKKCEETYTNSPPQGCYFVQYEYGEDSQSPHPYCLKYADFIKYADNKFEECICDYPNGADVVLTIETK